MQGRGGSAEFCLTTQRLPGGGGALTSPSPSDPTFIVGTNEILQKKVLFWLLLVRKLLDRLVSGPPLPPQHPLPLSRGTLGQRQEDLSFKIFSARLRRGPQGDPKRRGVRAKPPPPPPPF